METQALLALNQFLCRRRGHPASLLPMRHTRCLQASEQVRALCRLGWNGLPQPGHVGPGGIVALVELSPASAAICGDCVTGPAAVSLGAILAFVMLPSEPPRRLSCAR